MKDIALKGGRHIQAEVVPLKNKTKRESKTSEPATFEQRLPNVFQTSMAFGTRWVVVVQTSLVHWKCCDKKRCVHKKEK